MVVKASDGKHLFLSVDRCWNGQSFSVVFPAKYQIEAQEFVEYAAKYLQHEHGKAVFHWFTLRRLKRWVGTITYTAPSPKMAWI